MAELIRCEKLKSFSAPLKVCCTQWMVFHSTFLKERLWELWESPDVGSLP